jgi:2-polyprenyl-3-methyl-5-hydroxy-6-metoxy-1,4-benzoquinol methylase
MNKSEKFWDKRSKDYDKREKDFEQEYDKTIELTKKYLKINDIALDFACGTGVITNIIASDVKEIHGIDISSKMIAVAKRKAEEREIQNSSYSQSIIFDEIYKKESFTVILAFNILHLLEDTLKVMLRINELLKPGGLFISATPCMKDKKSFIGIMLFLLRKMRIIPYTKFLKFSELEGLIANGNFQIIKTEDLQENPPNYFVVAKKL